MGVCGPTTAWRLAPGLLATGVLATAGFVLLTDVSLHQTGTAEAQKQKLPRKARKELADARAVCRADARSCARMIELTTQACDNGHKASCERLADAYEEGKYGLPKDDALSLKFRAKLCNLGEKGDCYQVGHWISIGRGVPWKNEAKVVEFFKAACQYGHELSCDKVAWRYFEGHGLHKDQASAAKYIRKLLILTDKCPPTHDCNWAVQDEMSKYEDTRAQVENCDKGNVESCDSAGWRYSGWYPPKAVKLYDRACEGGHAESCKSAGGIFRRDYAEGIVKDDAKVFEYYAKACSLGDTEGCERAREAGSDIAELVRAYEMGCEAGTGAICYEAAMLHASGDGVTKDDMRAVEFCSLACERGHELGCVTVTKYQADGAGALTTAVAVWLLQTKCDEGNDMACWGAVGLYREWGGEAQKLMIAILESMCDRLTMDQARISYQSHIDCLNKYGSPPGSPPSLSSHWKQYAAEICGPARRSNDDEAKACHRLAELSGSFRLHVKACRLGHSGSCAVVRLSGRGQALHDL